MSYIVAPTAGCHATIGIANTAAWEPAPSTNRPVGARPETNGRPADVTTGRETLPNVHFSPDWQRSCGTAVSWYSIGMSVGAAPGAEGPLDAAGIAIAVTGTTVQ